MMKFTEKPLLRLWGLSLAASVWVLGCAHSGGGQRPLVLDPVVGFVPEWAERDPKAWKEFRAEKVAALQLLERAVEEKVPWTLYSLTSPNYPSLDSYTDGDHVQTVPEDPVPKLGRFLIVAQTEEARPAIQQELAEALAESIRRSDGTVAACFMPHHGIRIPFAEGPVDLLICFSCSSMSVLGDESVRYAAITGEGFSSYYRIWNELELPQDYLKKKIRASSP